MEPAKLRSIEADDVRTRLKILVAEDQLSLAIGKRGQNARLTSRLTGWEVDIDAEHIVTKGFDEKVAEAVAQIALIPGITREQADALVHVGIFRLEDLLAVQPGDLTDIPEIGASEVTILQAAQAEATRRAGSAGDSPAS